MRATSPTLSTIAATMGGRHPNPNSNQVRDLPYPLDHRGHLVHPTPNPNTLTLTLTLGDRDLPYPLDHRGHFVHRAARQHDARALRRQPALQRLHLRSHVEKAYRRTPTLTLTLTLALALTLT